jgi:hypothetical protein
MVVQMLSSHVITYHTELCCKRKLFNVCLHVLVTLNMLKTHTADNMSSIFDGSHAVSIVWVLALGNRIANRDSIGDHTRVLSMNILKLHRISIAWKDASSSKKRHTGGIQMRGQSLHCEVSSDTCAIHPLVQS